jgi:pimeloyl-ACP methyl ester carboxylesterase
MRKLLLPLVLLFSSFAAAQPKSINTESFVSLGGIEQWVTIKGDDITKPVVLFLHGGPGSVMSPYADEVYKGWRRDFVVVNWDQRGAGRTFGRNAPADVTEDYWIEHPLTIERMVDDGIELSQHVVKALGQRKLILVATSWGSILGAKMALKRPDLFHAYVGHAQVVNFNLGLESAYRTVYEMAAAENDSLSVAKLAAIGKPPYQNAKDAGQLLRVVKKYERQNPTPAPDSWWQVAAQYDNERDAQYRENGDDYSFINLIGHKPLGIKSMVSEVDFESDGLSFQLPVYLLQGAHDILTPPNITKRYFDALRAPKKEYILIPDAAHGHNQSVIAAQHEIVKEISKAPLKK